MKFKEYDQIKSEIDFKTGNNFTLDKQYCSTINRLPIEHRKFLFLLIYHHYNINNNINKDNINTYDIPYNGKVGNESKGICYDISCFPLELQKIIAKYIDSVII
jgi:hypothetical protein